MSGLAGTTGTGIRSLNRWMLTRTPIAVSDVRRSFASHFCTCCSPPPPSLQYESVTLTVTIGATYRRGAAGAPPRTYVVQPFANGAPIDPPTRTISANHDTFYVASFFTLTFNINTSALSTLVVGFNRTVPGQ